MVVVVGVLATKYTLAPADETDDKTRRNHSRERIIRHKPTHHGPIFGRTPPAAAVPQPACMSAAWV